MLGLWQDVRKRPTFGFTPVEFKPVYQVCCPASVNQGNNCMVSQRFRKALTTEGSRLRTKPGIASLIRVGQKRNCAA